MDKVVVNSRKTEEQHMILGDLPSQFEPVIDSEQIRHETAAREKLSVDALYLVVKGKINNTGEKMAEDILNIGAVDRMVLPGGWVKGAEQTQIAGQGKSSQFLASGKKDVELTVFDRGRKYQSNASAFKEILEKAPHVLSPKELESLGGILGNYNDARAFKMTACRTEDINGKNVVVIEGIWNTVGHKSYSILANPDGKGETVQEIYYKAPSSEFQAYFNPAMQAIKSIRWKAI